MTTRARAGDPAEFLALVPEMIGFLPADSLVLVGLAGGVTCGALRVGLPRPSAPGGRVDDGLRRSVARRVVDVIARDPEAEGAMAVVYTARPWREAHDERSLIGTVALRLDRTGLRLRAGYLVAADGWGEYDAAPRPMAEIEAAVALRRLDPEATPWGGSPEAAAALPVRGVFECERTARALADLRTEAVHGGGDVDPLWFAAYSATWAADEVGPATAALTALMLADPELRDVLIVAWAWGRERGRDALRLGERRRREGRPPGDDGREWSALAGTREAGRPSPEAVEHIVAVLREVASLLPRSERAPTLTVLAWFSWSLGRGSVAGGYLDQARAVDPRLELAALLEAVLDRGLLPEWSFPVRGARTRRSRRVVGRA